MALQLLPGQFVMHHVPPVLPVLSRGSTVDQEITAGQSSKPVWGRLGHTAPSGAVLACDQHMVGRLSRSFIRLDSISGASRWLPLVPGRVASDGTLNL